MGYSYTNSIFFSHHMHSEVAFRMGWRTMLMEFAYYICFSTFYFRGRKYQSTSGKGIFVSLSGVAVVYGGPVDIQVLGESLLLMFIDRSNALL